ICFTMTGFLILMDHMSLVELTVAFCVAFLVTFLWNYEQLSLAEQLGTLEGELARRTGGEWEDIYIKSRYHMRSPFIGWLRWESWCWLSVMTILIVSLYAAQTTKDRYDVSQTQEEVWFERFRRFENEVVMALKEPNSPLAEYEIRTEAYMVARSDDKVYIIDVKTSRSKSPLDSAAEKVRNYVKLYRNTLGSEDLKVLPLIIAPSTSIP